MKRRGCRRAGIRQRFGPIGKHGSIPLVERCIRTIKDEGVQRWLASIRWRTVGTELSLFADWYNGQRPHAGLACGSVSTFDSLAADRTFPASR